jgi:hypothetical protein
MYNRTSTVQVPNKLKGIEQQTEYIAVKDTFSYDKLNRWYFEMLEKVGLDDEWYDFAT